MKCVIGVEVPLPAIFRIGRSRFRKENRLFSTVTVTYRIFVGVSKHDDWATKVGCGTIGRDTDHSAVVTGAKLKNINAGREARSIREI